MITRLKVRKFRSLLDFSVRFRPGVNVLVGPNGSGKTNVVKFLDFLSNLITGGVPLAFDKAGGAVQVFSAEELVLDGNPTFDFEVHGALDQLTPVDTPYFGLPEPNVQCDGYRYSCQIVYDKKLQGVYISKETLTLVSADEMVLSVDRETIGRADENKTFYNSIRVSPKVGPLYNFVATPRHKKDEEDLERRIGLELSPEQSVLTTLDTSHQLYVRVAHSLTSLSSINVSPSAARAVTSVSDTSMIDDTGRGLTSVLSRLKMQRYFPYGLNYRVNRGLLGPREQAVTFRSILNWVSQVNPDVEDINVWPDTFSASLRAEVVMRLDGQRASFSFDKVSDGTIKWIALVTILFTSPHYGSIEEPENFLHPRMQDAFVTLLRERLSTSRNALVTTHSESLLNVCAPSELLVFRFGATGTQARRPANADQLDEALRKGRFMLGHYYRTGAIDA